jgi:hypothetical protein
VVVDVHNLVPEQVQSKGVWVMSNRRDLPSMSIVSSQKRLEQAKMSFGATAVTRLISLALYLLGANLRELAAFAGTPLDTIKTLAKRTLRDGLPALEDRRRKRSDFLPINETRPLSCRLLFEKDAFVVVIDGKKRIALSRRNPTQCRTVLLTLLEANLLDIEEVSRAIGLSPERTRKLRAALVREDVEALLDRRRGQQRDYLFTSEVKSELVQQFVLNALSGWPTSGRAIAEDLERRCDIQVSERSVRLYLNKLGLSGIADSLLELIEAQKKTSSNS